MSGPLSVPSRDKQFNYELRTFRCDIHKDCYGEQGTKKNPCSMIPFREWLLKRNKLRTGKTRG